MKTVTVNTASAPYDIHVGHEILRTAPVRAALQQKLGSRSCLVVSDSQVAPLYEAQLSAVLRDAGATVLGSEVFAAGEASKTLATVEELYHAGLRHGLDREAAIIALGGGVVGDVAGFVAATLLRGIRCVQVPTTLLAMVDSSVGGKVGVDLSEGKNLVGAFAQPQLVLAELACLKTLPARELRSGLGEVIKYAMILDDALFELLAARVPALRDLDLELYETVVDCCCQHKARIVAADEREQGQREILNYGHTFGHAIEQLGQYRELRHGEGIAVGMAMAAALAVRLGLAPATVKERQDTLLQRYGLPVRLQGHGVYTPAAILAAMYRDKKVRGGTLRLVLPRRVGEVTVIECTDESAILHTLGEHID